MKSPFSPGSVKTFKGDFQIKVDAKEFNRNFTALQRQQLPFAISVAVNRVAYLAMTEQKTQHIPQHIDRPTRWTLNSVRYVKGTKKEPVAQMGFDEGLGQGGTPAWKYLQHLIFGGRRSQKRFEKLFENNSPHFQGMFMMPGKRQRLDRHGNFPPGQLQKVLSAAKVQNDSAQNSKGKQGIFAGKLKGKSGTVGVFQRTGKWKGARTTKSGKHRKGKEGRSVKPLFVATKKRPTYRVSYPFERTVNQTVAENYQQEFRAALAYAVKTATKKSVGGP